MSSLRPLVALIITTLVAALALCWGTWRLIGQERALQWQRQRALVESAADAFAISLKARLTLIDGRLRDFAAEARDPVSAMLLFSVNTVEARPKPLIYEPQPPSLTEPPESVFVEADRSNSIVIFEGLTHSPNAAIRAGAWLRIGRMARREGRMNDALAAYGKLAREDGVQIAGVPASLIGVHSRASMGEKSEVAALRQQLLEGRWRLTRGQFAFYWGDEMPPPQSPVAEQAAQAWTQWKAGAASPLTLSNGILFWRGNVGTIVPVGELLQAPSNLRVSLERNGERAAVVLGPGETGLPWTLFVSAAAPAENESGRERLLLLGLATILGLLFAGAYFIARVIRREMEVAQLKSHFVAAVSHEFRTPLTSIRQFAEILAAGRVPNAARQQQYYESLIEETAKLQRLVETLLNFGRMESDASRYRFAHVDAGALIDGVVQGFRLPEGKSIQVSKPAEGPYLSADANALAVALRNLIENALQYSPECPEVWVECETQGKRVAIRVRDRGVGIPRSEHRMIFQRFVRGSSATAAGVGGTGVGLAMVEHIARAHGAEVRLESEPGKGSTFTLLLNT